MLLAIRDSPWRRQLCRWLEAMGVTPVSQARSIDARPKREHSDSDDLVLVETYQPDGDAHAVVSELRNEGWHRIIVAAEGPDPYAVRDALRTGASGYLFLPNIDDDLPVQLDDDVVPPSSDDPLFPGKAVDSVDGKAQTLSPPEIRVLHLVAKGMTNKEIGEAQGLSPLTVKRHLARIAHKLHTGDRAQLVLLAMRAGAFR
ncbi:LuxR C-terminal-related transcriptional regulator [Amycolatopsis sp. NPDC049868]|uniref:LuxR family transcriptional regulator n=1 Tax=Amycolatopsis sp. NPDC049868 TaxID=3363934 RepID=UPI003796133E